MQMIASVSDWITDFFASHGVIAAEEKEVYSYGFAAIISTIISYGIILAIAAVLHCIWLWIVFILCFSPLRRYSGGYHASSYIRCKTIYAITFLLIALAVNYFAQTNWLLLPMIVGAFGITVVCLLAPVVPRNKELLQEEISVNRRKSILIVIAEGICVLLFLKFCYAVSLSISFIMLAVSMALLAEIFITKRSVDPCRKNPC